MQACDRRAFLGGALGSLAATRGLGREESPRPCRPEAWSKGPVALAFQGEAADGRGQNFTSPAEPLEGGRWRLWYSLAGARTPGKIGYFEGAPGQPGTMVEAVLSAGEPADAPLAVGNLPDGWRPVQPVHLQLPDGEHRLYFWARGEGTHRYLVATSRDGRRYRVVDPARACLYHPNDRAVSIDAGTEAGLPRMARARKNRGPRVDKPAAPARLVSNDAADVYRLDDGSFEMYSVGLVEVDRDDPRYVAHDNAAGLIRVIDRRVSRDGIDWSERQRVLVPDASDPIDMQFYYLAVTHTERGRVGMLGHYRVQAQTMDLEWCFSVDGARWERPTRAPWIPRGRPGEPDSYGIYAPHRLVRHEGRWWLFYTAVNTAHNERDAHGKPSSAIMLARCDSIWA